jgi:hypothetical protein
MEKNMSSEEFVKIVAKDVERCTQDIAMIMDILKNIESKLESGCNCNNLEDHG